MKQGTYLDTSEKEYRAWPAINYSSLSKFNESQDHALMVTPAKSYFEFGNAFELLVQDQATGTTRFPERFFLAGAPGEMPDNLAQWVEKEEDLDGKYRYNKDGVTLSGTSKRLHLWLDECRHNQGKMPIGRDQMQALTKMVENFIKMQPFADEVSRKNGVYSENTLAEILPVCHFQVPIIWYVGNKMKKALIDCMLETDGTIYVFDIKTAADMKRFFWMLKDKYWIQEAHYTAGLKSIFKDKEIVWRFLVSCKAEPWISQPYCVEPYNLQEYGMDEYYDLCNRYQDWLDEGKPPKGWKELETVKLFFN